MNPLALSPIGLLLAALLSLLNVFGGVCRKHVVDRQEVVAASFWIRLFAAAGFTVILVLKLLFGSAPMLHTSAVLKPGHLQHLPVLVERLNWPENAAEARVAAGLSAPTRQLLARYHAGQNDQAVDRSLRTDLAKAFLQNGPLLYNAQDFAGVPLSAETQRIVAMRPTGTLAGYANRLLLQDLFPGLVLPARGSDLFGIDRWIVAPGVAFAVYAVVLSLLIAGSQLMANYSLKISPISLSLPFMSFSPLFLTATSYLVLHELPNTGKLMGVGLIFVGGLLMHRQLFAVSWRAPVAALIKEPGCRSILLACMMISITAPLEKKMLVLSDWQTVGFCYGVGTTLLFWLLSLQQRVDLKLALRRSPWWTVTTGLVDAGTVLLQFAAVLYLPVVVVICIKRAGIILTILAGWLIFREKQIGDRLIAASAMTGGVLVFYLALPTGQSLLLTGLCVAAVATALHLTRGRGKESGSSGCTPAQQQAE